MTKEFLQSYKIKPWFTQLDINLTLEQRIYKRKALLFIEEEMKIVEHREKAIKEAKKRRPDYSARHLRQKLAKIKG